MKKSVGWMIFFFIGVVFFARSVLAVAAVSHQASEVIMPGGGNLNGALSGFLAGDTICTSRNTFTTGSPCFDDGSQWANGATSGRIYYNGGNVGIGTSNPNSKFVVAGENADRLNARQIVSTNWDGGAARHGLEIGYAYVPGQYSEGVIQAWDDGSTVTLMLSPQGGGVKIGGLINCGGLSTDANGKLACGGGGGGDNLGNHMATQALNLNGNAIINIGSLSTFGDANSFDILYDHDVDLYIKQNAVGNVYIGSGGSVNLNVEGMVKIGSGNQLFEFFDEGDNYGRFTYGNVKTWWGTDNVWINLGGTGGQKLHIRDSAGTLKHSFDSSGDAYHGRTIKLGNFASPPYACDANSQGSIYYDTSHGVSGVQTAFCGCLSTGAGGSVSWTWVDLAQSEDGQYRVCQ